LLKAQLSHRQVDIVSPIYIPLAALAGFAFHYLVVSSGANNHRRRLARRLAVVVVLLPLICLVLWVCLCYGFKLLTWRPFGGDAPGSVAMTNVLLLAGSALVGVWISARLRGQQVSPTP
jgi:hypothetical protein